MPDDVGIWSVRPEQITALGLSFTTFVNRLLDAAAAGAGLAGVHLVTTHRANVGDKGVDAALQQAVETRWLPSGESVWQFKAGDLKPAKCKTELQGATFAHDRLRAGAKYRLVLGAGLNATKIADRKKALREEAAALNLPSAPDVFEVLDADALARWASDYPSLAVSELLNGPGQLACDHAAWLRFQAHRREWVEADDRRVKIDEIQDLLSGTGPMDVRIEGVSGVGKSRLALEALRDPRLAPLVAYVPEGAFFSSEFLNHIAGDSRAAILVIDECDARRHEKLAEQLRVGQCVRLITIGSPDLYAISSPLISLSPMAADAIDELLKVNFPEVWEEARRFVVDYCEGNPRFAIVLAEKIKATGRGEAASLIDAKDIARFITTLLLEGHDFLGGCLLALFDRVGWEREKRTQMEAVAAFWGVPPDKLDEVAAELERRGLLIRVGRYRAIAPQPLATYLAAEAWRQMGDRVADELLPSLDNEMSLALFMRAASLGRFEPATATFRTLLSAAGPFGTLDRVETGNQGRHLTQLAIALPEEAVTRLSAVIERASIDDLRAATSSRRDLVWTLEKLVWHRTTFRLAADALLKLALAENETYGNNATATWLAVFGTLLPITAATPAERLAYLEHQAGNTDGEVRTLVARGCGCVLNALHESAMVSGELQGGAIVERRGTPETWDEIRDYRLGAIKTLRRLATDDDDRVAEAASTTLVGAIHGLIDDALVGDALSEALLALSGAHLEAVRKSVVDILRIYERTGVSPDREVLVQRLEKLRNRLPKLDPLGELRLMVDNPAWEDRGEALAKRLVDQIRKLNPDEALEATHGWLAAGEVKASWELGYAMAVANLDPDGAADFLASVFAVNGAALAGYLSGKAAIDGEDAFDRYLDGPVGASLEPVARLVLTVRGPATDRASQRIRELLPHLSVLDGIRGQFGWQRNLQDEDIVWMVTEWLPRLTSDADYMALVDWLGMALYNRQTLSAEVRAIAYDVVTARRRYPDVGQERWDWARLGERFIADRPLELAELVLDLFESGDFVMQAEDEEADILARAAQSRPAEVWETVGRRIEEKQWRVQFGVRRWLIQHIPIDVVEDWVSASVDRARVVAGVANVGSEEPTAVARFLLDRFGDDDTVRSDLAGAFISGVWMGKESDRLAGQIAQLSRWRLNPNEPAGVRLWATEMIEYLERHRASALERDAEERW